ncbi:copper chaperone PCu(A)C [Litorimonas sp. WD9-15]|uniref:copper chaperone PCu(A)C n=1 Tax=Litorimonas sp. WD9-15 TaxID=3418716 RepID=UPI003D016B7C
MKKLLVLSAAILAACSAASTEEGIEISDIRFNPPLPGQTTGVGFMSLENKGPADRLISASSPLSDNIELHTHLNDNGVMRMRKVDAIDLPAGETVELKPGDYHIMIFDTEMVAGEETTVTLDFETAEDVTLVVPVVPRGTAPKASGHGSDTQY